jgi:hypothetical protein
MHILKLISERIFPSHREGAGRCKYTLLNINKSSPPWLLPGRRENKGFFVQAITS